MAIPYQKKKRIFNDPIGIVEADSAPTAEGSSNLRLGNIKNKILLEKSPLYFSITEMMFGVVALFLIQILPSWMGLVTNYFGIPDFNPWWGSWVLTGLNVMAQLLLLTGYLSYVFDWKLDYVKRVAQKTESSRHYRLGYIIGVLACICLFAALVYVFGIPGLR
jgi:hypothetical protein